MKRILFNVSILLLISSCSKFESYNPDKYFNKNQKDTLLVDLITYIAPKPEGSEELRNSAALRPYYKERISFFNFEYYYPAKDSVYYFLISKVAPSVKEEKIDVGGYFKRKDGKISEFVEVFNTPKMSQEELKIKDKTLFEELVQNGNVEKYLQDRTYIEFPNDHIYYNKQSNAWKAVDSQ